MLQYQLAQGLGKMFLGKSRNAVLYGDLNYIANTLHTKPYM